MQTKVIEATNGPNWGKFLLGRLDTEWSLQSSLKDIEGGILPGPLLRQLGWSTDHLWVLDLQTGEGAFFRPGGSADADLRKHAIWVCPLFLPLIRRLWEMNLTNLDKLPDLIEFTLDEAPFDMQGQRWPGPEGT